MKQTIIFIVLLIFFIISHSYAQWYPQDSGGIWLNRVDFVSVDVGWAGAYWEIIKTTDSGETWNTIYEIPQTNTAVNSFDFVDVSNGWLLMYVSGISGTEIYHTTDGGETWSLQYTSDDLYWEIQFIDENSGWCIGNTTVNPIILITTDGGINWFSEYVDPNNYPDLNLVNFINANEGWAAGQALYKTTDGGFTWTTQISAYTFMMGIQFVNSEIGWYTDSQYLLKTTDGGNSWNQQFYHGTLGWNAAPFFFTDTDNGWIAYHNIIYHTTNGGADWVWQSPGAGLGAADIYFVDENIGWIVGSGGTILHTINGGLPVELVSFTAEVKENTVILNWETATELNNNGFEILRRVYPSERGEISDDSDWNKIGYVPGHGTTTEPQSYFFTDEPLSPANYEYRLKQIDFDGTYEYSEIVMVEVEIPNKFVLQQNYPNPFNPSTNIKFTIPVVETGHAPSVQLKVYDVLGNEVVTLINKEMQAGSYEVEFSATGRDDHTLPSGIYFYKLKAGSFVETKKMVLMK
jgi:photosystem II stability/assembly factor-like uncharacterized protein